MKHHRLRLAELNWPCIAIILMIAALGVYNLHSAAFAKAPDLYLTQLSWLGVGSLLAIVALSLDYRITENLAYVIYGIVCVALLAVLMQGKVAGGARRWLVLGPMTFQPSEIAKLATVFCLARYFSSRMPQNGYSLRALFRLLNPSRPIAVAAALIVCWDKPWLSDPMGELARAVVKQSGNTAPIIGDVLWFRVLLGIAIAAGAGLGTMVVLKLESRARLSPWPPKRRIWLLSGIGTAAVLAAAALALFWQTPILRDPLGSALNGLYLAAATPDGPYHVLQQGYVLRMTWVACAALYGLLALLAYRQDPRPWSEVLIAPIDLLAVPALLVQVQPDLGTAGIIILIGMTMILVVGVRRTSLVILAVLGAATVFVGWFGFLKDYQKRRILTFINPEHDITGDGWNAVQSMIAVGSGRWFGKGHLGGTQTQFSFLPEQHTDFAFSVWAEEQGFLGCLLILLLFSVLLVLAFSIAASAREPYGALLATGIAALVLWQAIINISMVIGVFPVVGLTLPLFSYGGSSVMTVMLGLGLLLNVHWRRRSL